MLPEATARFAMLVAAAKQMLEEAGVVKLVSGMHLLAEKLVHRQPFQGNLFSRPDPSADRIAQVKKFVNEKVGRFAVRSGDTLPLSNIYADETNDYDICDVRGKSCF